MRPGACVHGRRRRGVALLGGLQMSDNIPVVRARGFQETYIYMQDRPNQWEHQPVERIQQKLKKSCKYVPREEITHASIVQPHARQHRNPSP
jgi:hypothetical protein